MGIVMIPQDDGTLSGNTRDHASFTDYLVDNGYVWIGKYSEMYRCTLKYWWGHENLEPKELLKLERRFCEKWWM